MSSDSMSSSLPPNADGREEESVSPLRPKDRGRSRSSMKELRRLLLQPDRSVVSDLQRRVEALELEENDLLAAEVSAVLPDAIRHTDEAGDLAEALSPTIEKTLHVSVERDPEPIVDAIFPVIGPAIRKSVSEALQSLVANVNQTLEHGFSLKGLRWRWEAWRTGRSFADVVLRHTLLFRVEQLFLIDRETGLPMQHLTAEAVEAEDGALVSGMLTAIQDFVHDSFELEGEETLQDFSVGDLSVWVDHGPRAALAAVIRGTPDPRLREELHRTTEQVHRRFREALLDFEGDPETLREARPVLREAMLVQYEPPRRRPSPAFWMLAVLLLAGLGWWGYHSWTQHQRWDAFLDTLDATPGLVVTQTGTDGGRWTVDGLRDPLAADPDSLLQQASLHPADVRATWRPYQSLDPSLVAQRAHRRIEQEVVLFREETTLLDGQQVVLNRLSSAVLDVHEAASALGIPVQIRVRGHHSAEGRPEVNRQLAEARAAFVRRALRTRGVPAAVIHSAGAVTEPIHPRLVNTDEGRTFNRGVTLRVRLGDLPSR